MNGRIDYQFYKLDIWVNVQLKRVPIIAFLVLGPEGQ